MEKASLDNTTMKGKHYWQCPNAQCDAEWYSDDPKDYYCPKCGVGPCAEAWHPDDFDKFTKRLAVRRDLEIPEDEIFKFEGKGPRDEI